MLIKKTGRKFISWLLLALILVVCVSWCNLHTAMSNQLKKQPLVTPRDLHIGLNPHSSRQLLRRRQDALGRGIVQVVTQRGAVHCEA